MRQSTALTMAAAAAATFGAVDAQAATLNYSLTFAFSNNIGSIDGSGSSGTGAFSIDSADLVGNTNVTDPTKIHDFSATFINVPSLGTLTFDQADLDAVNLKHSDQTITAAAFGTQDNGTDPFLSITGIFSTTTRLNLDSETAIDYNATATQIPEPGTLSLLAAGAALPLIRRRRAQRKAA